MQNNQSPNETTNGTIAEENAATEAPVAVCDCTITKERFDRVNDILLRKTKCLPPLYIALGILFLTLFALLILFRDPGEAFSFSEYVPELVIGAAMLGLGIFFRIIQTNAKKKGYDTYLSVNPDPNVHVEFFSDRFTVSNKNEQTTRYYSAIISWAETGDLYLLYFGNKLSSFAVFVYKTGFISADDERAFSALMRSVLAGKKYKRLK